MNKLAIVTTTLMIAVNVGLMVWDIHTGHASAAACNGFAAGFLSYSLLFNESATGAS